MGRKQKGWSVFQRAGDKQFTLAYQASPGEWKQHRIPPTVATERSAARYAEAWLAEKVSQRGTMAGRTMAELYPEWIAMRESNPKLAKSTVSDNASHFRNYILPELGSKSLDALDPSHVRGLVRGLRLKFAANTVRNAVTTLSSFYDDARAEGWIKTSENIVRHPGVQKEMPESESVEVVWIPRPDAQRLIDCVAVPLHRRVKYLLAFFTGLRDGELCGLLWSNIAMDAPVPTLRVDAAFAYRAGEGYAGMSKPKTRDSRRTIPIAATALGALRWWFEEGWSIYVGRDPLDTDPVFPGPSGRHSRPKSAELIREDLLAAGSPTGYNGDDVVFHSTRSSFSTWLNEAGVDGEVIDRLLGHAGKSTRERHYTGELLAKLLRATDLIGLRWDCGPSCGGKAFGVDRSAENDLEIHAVGRLSSVVEQRFRKPSPAAAESDEEDDEPPLSVVFDRLTFGSGDGDERKEGTRASAQRFLHKPKLTRRRKVDEVHERDLLVARGIEECIQIAKGDTTLPESERRAAVEARLEQLSDILLEDHGPLPEFGSVSR